MNSGLPSLCNVDTVHGHLCEAQAQSATEKGVFLLLSSGFPNFAARWDLLGSVRNPNARPQPHLARDEFNYSAREPGESTDLDNNLFLILAPGDFLCPPLTIVLSRNAHSLLYKHQ